MAFPSLLVMPDNDRALAAFNFDHDMIHRAYIPGYPQSNIPYIFDPVPPQTFASRARNWQQLHQQAHADLSSARVTLNKPMMDSNLGDPESRTWWTFINNQEHYIAQI